MNLKIAVLAGDGIGPEISQQGVAVMSAVCNKFNHSVTFKNAICGADAIDITDDVMAELTNEQMQNNNGK